MMALGDVFVVLAPVRTRSRGRAVAKSVRLTCPLPLIIPALFSLPVLV